MPTPVSRAAVLLIGGPLYTIVVTAQVELHVLGITQDAGRPQLGCTKACCVKDGKPRPCIPVVSLGITQPDPSKGEFPRPISNDKYNDYIKKVCKLAGVEDEVQGTKAEVIKMKRGDRMVSATRKKHGRFAKWELVSSHIGRRSFATNHFEKIPTPIIMAATGHKSESSFLKYIGKGRAEMVSMLAEYWYGGDVEQKSKQTYTA